MVDCLADLILRPGRQRPPVQIGLTLVAGVDTMTGGDEPGELDGQPVPGRDGPRTGLHPRPAPPTRPRRPRPAHPTDRRRRRGPTRPTPSPTRARRRPTPDDADEPRDRPSPRRADARARRRGRAPTDAAAAEAATPPGRGAGPAAPDQAAAAAGWASCSACAAPPAPRWPTCRGSRSSRRSPASCSPSPTPPASGTPPPAATRPAAPAKRPCTHPPAGPGLGPPPATPGYRPVDPLARFVRARDRRCRFPGCRAAAIRCDLDHNHPWPAGPTSADNLCCLCRHHHRLSHQAPGWTMTRLPDGGLQLDHPRRRHHHHPPAPLRHRRRPATPHARTGHPTHTAPRPRSACSNNSAAGHPHHRTPTTNPRPSERRPRRWRAVRDEAQIHPVSRAQFRRTRKPRRSRTSGVTRDYRDALTLRSGAHDLAGADARGARVDPATVAGGDERPHGLDVRVPTARRAAVRVRHRHTETGPLATHIAHGSHG